MARLVGGTFAHIQHLTDVVIDKGLHMMQEAGNQPEPAPKDDENKYVRTVKTGAKKTLKFLGDVGEVYYSTYGKLKRQQRR